MNATKIQSTKKWGIMRRFVKHRAQEQPNSAQLISLNSVKHDKVDEVQVQSNPKNKIGAKSYLD